MIDEHPDAPVIESYAPEAEEALPTKAKRKKSGMSPTKRCMDEIKKRGWIAQIVEKWVGFPPPGHRVDLFGVIDIIAIDPGEPASIVAIQASGGTGHAAHRAKILAEPRALMWTSAGGRLELWSWTKRGAAGKRKLWTLRVETYAEMITVSGAGV